MKLNRQLIIAAGISFITLTSSNSAFAASNADLQARIAKLEEELNLLKRQIEVKDEVQKSKEEKIANVEFGKKGLSVTSPDKNYSLKVRGYAQFDSRNFLDDKSTNSVNINRDEIVARRIRPVIEGVVAKDFSFRFMPDFGGSTTRVFDAYVEYKYNEYAGVRVGKYKPPVGLERLQSASDIDFIERGLPTNLAPSRDFGVQLQGDIIPELVEYQLGIFNGNEDLGNSDNDQDDKKDFIGRVFATPFKRSSFLALQNLGFGIGASTGDREGSATKTILPQYRSPGQVNIFTYSSGTYANGTIARLYPQAYYYYNSFGILGEYAITKQEVTNGLNNATLNHKAWQAIVSYVITGEDASFKGVKPQADFDPGKGNWGAFEVVGRIGSLDIDNKAFPIYSSLATSSTKEDSAGVGLNWYLNENIKVAINYDVTQFDGGATAADRPDEQALFSRLQFKF